MNRTDICRRVIAVAAVTFCASASLACSSQTGADTGAASDEPGATAQQAEGVEMPAPADEAREHRPLFRMVRESLAEIDLRADQAEAVQRIGADVDASTQAMRDARRDLALAVADGVEAGVLDEADINAKSAALTAAVNAGKPALQEALNRLHATLDAAQRRALVDKVRGKLEMAHAGDGEHHRGPHRGFHGPLGRVADQLRLTPQQKQTIRDIVRTELGLQGGGFDPDRHAGGRGARLRELGEAFVSEQFDATAMDIGREVPEAAQKIGHGLVRATRLALPVLTPDQRLDLARLIRRKAASHAE